MPPGRPRQLKLSQIRVEPDIQARVRLDDQAVADSPDALERGEKLPPVVVFVDRSGLYWLADGFHRIAAYRRLGRKLVPVHVQNGTRADAAWYALGANRANGVRMTNADKERAGKLALQMRPKASDRAIAAHVGVSDKTVAKNRSGAEIPHLNRREGRDGKTYPVPASSLDPNAYIDDSPPPVDDDPPPSTDELLPPSPAVGVSPAAAGDPPPPVETDRIGNPIPNDRIAEAFRRDHELTEWCVAVGRIKAAVLKSIEQQDPLYADLVGTQVQCDCDNLRRAIHFARPYAVCPYCGGEGCKVCHGRGWCNRITYKSAPHELKR